MPKNVIATSMHSESVSLIIGRGKEALTSHIAGEVREAVVAEPPVASESRVTLPPLLAGITHLILTDPTLTRSAAMAWLAAADQAGITVWIAAALLPELRRAGIHPQRIGTSPFYRFQGLKHTAGRGAIAALSPLMGLLALPLALPLLTLVGLRVWLTDGRPIVFAQKRIGYQNRRFTIYKFRTMLQARTRSARQITGAGERLRRHGLDELPQVFNLLLGSMALIGPRPLPIDEHPHGESSNVWMKTRARVMPGLTGLYQVCPGRRQLGLTEMCLLDAYWIHNRSLRLNTWIILRTVIAMFKGWGRTATPTHR